MNILNFAQIGLLLGIGIIGYIVVGQLLKRLSDLERDVFTHRTQIHDLKDRLNAVITENRLLRFMLGFPPTGPIPESKSFDISSDNMNMHDAVKGDKVTGSNQKSDSNIININIDKNDKQGD